MKRLEGQEERSAKLALSRAVRARAASDRALEAFHEAVREASQFHSRAVVGEAVGLSHSRIQQIVHAKP